MAPREFVLWLNGAAEIIGDGPPTAEQWALLRSRLGQAVGEIVAARLQGTGEVVDPSAIIRRAHLSPITLHFGVLNNGL